MTEDIISVFFLAIICIVISSIIYRIAPMNINLLVPSCAIISVMLWVAYDYMLNTKYELAMRKLNEERAGYSQTLDEIVYEINSLGDDDERPSVDEGFKSRPNYTSEKLVKQHPNEYDLEIYSGTDDIRKLYTHMGSNGDTQICNRMKYMGVQPRLSKDIRANYNKHTIEPLFQEELNEQENKIWWEMDMLDVHT